MDNIKPVESDTDENWETESESEVAYVESEEEEDAGRGDGTQVGQRHAAAVNIQSHVRGFLVRKEINEKREKAATLIEANVRGYLVRRHERAGKGEEAGSETEKDGNNGTATKKNPEADRNTNEEKRESGKEDVEFGERVEDDDEGVGNQTDGEVGAQKSLDPMEAAATKIQAKFRSFDATKAYNNQKEAALVIQKNVRGHLTRNKMKKGKLEDGEENGMENVDGKFEERKAAVIIQKNVRGFLVRSKSLASNQAKSSGKRIHAEKLVKSEAAVIIQKNVRGFLVRSKSLASNQTKTAQVEKQVDFKVELSSEGAPKSLDPMGEAACKIQAKFRSFDATKSYKNQKDAALTIQKNIRGFLTRKKLEIEGPEKMMPPVETRCCCSPQTPEATPSPSPEPDPRLKNDVTVNIEMPDGKTMTIATVFGSTVLDLKVTISRILVFRPDLMELRHEGYELEDDSDLLPFVSFPFTTSTIALKLQSKDPPHIPLPSLEAPDHLKVITVNVASEASGVQTLQVEIVRDFRRKFFIGGYRSKTTGEEFHHAAVQTMPRLRKHLVERFHRDTQTASLKTIAVDTPEETNTQMTKIGVYVTNKEDRIMIPAEKYVTADEYHAVLVSKVLVLQKYWRRWLAQRRVKQLVAFVQKKHHLEAEEAQRRQREKEARLRLEFEKKVDPKTKKDMDILFHDLESWRKAELDHINATMTGAERKAELCRLMEQEAAYINSIGKHQNNVQQRNKLKGVEKFLDNTAAPKEWKGPDGKRTLVDTPFILKARELKELYKSITMKHLKQDERLDILLTLVQAIAPYKCRLTQDIREMIEREADLLMRGIKPKDLEGLRKRIATLLLQFIRTPQFNPEAAKHHRVPQDPSVLRGATYICLTCQRYFPTREFLLISNSTAPGKCRSCRQNANDAHDRTDLGFYGVLLRNLQRSEAVFDDDSRICHLIHETDIKYLVDTIWYTRSALSLHDNVYDLMLLRWNKEEEWSPWNCLLLTKEEAEAHRQLENVNAAYNEAFLKKIAHKHNIAKNHFIRLPWMVKYVKSKTTPKPMMRVDPSVDLEVKGCRLRTNAVTGEEKVVHEVACGHKQRTKLIESFMVRAMKK